MTVLELVEMVKEQGLDPANVDISIMGADVQYTEFRGNYVILDECPIDEDEEEGNRYE